jgi:HEAT repeat protein
MKKVFALVALLGLCAVGAWAQNPQELLKSYTRNFAIASIDVKIELIRDAGETGYRELGPLYLQAVDYVLNNYAVIDTDQRFRQLAVAALNRLREVDYREARNSVWKLFDQDDETGVRLACLGALAVLAQGDEEIVDYLNRWLQAQNTVFQTGTVPDPYVVSACVRTLGKLGDPSSFAVLFSTMDRGYTDDISREARAALLSLGGDLESGILRVLREGSLEERREALGLALALGSDRLSEEEKAEVATFALDVGLHTGLADNPSRQIAREIRFAAARALSERRWSRATPLAIEHFDAVLQEYERGLSDINRVLEAIALLGNMGSHEAAVRLTQYLMLLNSLTESVQEYDGRIVLAVITNLGKLGDNVAFDDLMYAQYLSYSPEVKRAIRQALENLKW